MKERFYFQKSVLMTIAFLLVSIFTFAQDRRVTGKVLGSDGSGIPGASIQIKGTNIGTSTNVSGDFAINVRSGNDVLAVSSVGYKSQDVKVGVQSIVTVTLAEDVSDLSEVVVTGYSVDTRRETTGSVSIVKPKDLTVRPSGNVEQLLQGLSPGVTVISNGQPGSNSQVRVRGFGAFGGNEPLYVVDGVPVGSIDFLVPDDIETVTVLKDASAASIYGARAANGVIVYTTKKGSHRAKKLTVTYDGMYGVTDPGTGQAMMNPTDFAQYTWNAFTNDGFQAGKAPVYSHPQFGTGSSPVLPDYINVGGKAGVIGSVDLAAEKLKYNVDPTAGNIYQVVRAAKSGTDWYKAITQMAPVQRHTLGFSGGTESSRYYISVSAQEQAGIEIYNQFKRYSLRANTEFNVLKNFRIGENVQFTYRSIQGQGGANNGAGVAADENDILQAFRMPSIIPVYDEFGGYAGTAAKGFNNPRNPVASRDGLANDRSFNANGIGNLYAEWDPIPGLTLRTSIGGQFNTFFNRGYGRLQYENSENNSAFSFGEGGGYNFAWVFTNTANYKKKFGLHGIDILVGEEALNTGAGRNLSGNGLNPFSTDINYVNLSTVSATGKVVNSGLFSGVNFFSLFGQAKYSYNDRYYVTAVVRRDGSSRFGANNRFGVFPAFSAAWRISSEKFMNDLPFITDLKIRGG